MCVTYCEVPSIAMTVLRGHGCLSRCLFCFFVFLSELAVFRHLAFATIAVSDSSHIVTSSCESNIQTWAQQPFRLSTDDQHCALFFHSCVSHALSHLPKPLTVAPVPTRLLYSHSVSTCHWTLCFIFSGGELNKDWWSGIWSECTSW